MNFKKMAIAAAAGALLLGSSMPAFANNFDNVLMIKNKADVRNFTLIRANTGGNVINAGDDVECGLITSGEAMAAADVASQVNTNMVDSYTGDDDSRVSIKNDAKVRNITIALANTGDNEINASEDVDGGHITTGVAMSSGIVTNVVNTNTISGVVED